MVVLFACYLPKYHFKSLSALTSFVSCKSSPKYSFFTLRDNKYLPSAHHVQNLLGPLPGDAALVIKELVIGDVDGM